jgi:hypothetical protein
VSGFYRFDFGVNGDWGFNPANIYVDNVRLVQTAPVPQLKLRVNRATGAATLQNNSGSPITFDYYEITSNVPGDTNSDKDADGGDFLTIQRGFGTATGATVATGDVTGDGAVNNADFTRFRSGFGTHVGSINAAGWSSLDDQNVDIFDGSDPDAIPGSNPAEGWAEAGGSDSTRLTEAFLAGMTTIANGAAPLNMGTLFTPTKLENVVFRYREPGRPTYLRPGIVEFFTPPGTAVPEPTTGSFALAALAFLVAGRGRRCAAWIE